MLILTINS